MGARRGEVGSKLQGPGERVDPGGCAFRGGIFHSKRWAGGVTRGVWNEKETERCV